MTKIGYINFKQTEIGLIPEDWEVLKLGDIVNEVISGDWGNSKPSDKEELIKCKVVRGTDFSKLEKITFSDIPERFLKASSLEKRAIKSGDLLIEISGGSKDQPTGRVFYACDEILDKAVSPLMFTNFVKLIRVNEDIAHSEYAYRYWQYLYSSGRTRIYEKQTTNIRNFKYNDFLESEVISLPSLPEQRKIAKVLSTIQRAIEQQDKIIEATRKVKNSLMHKLFTEGLNGEEQKETEIGLIPKNWEVVRLEEMFDMQQGKAMSPKSRLGISPHPFLRTINILWGNVDLSILDHMDFTDEEMTKLCLQPDDLLVCEGGEIGRTAMWRGEIEVCGYQNHIHRLRKQRQDICPEFYMYWMQAAFLIFGLYAGEEIRTTIPNLSRGRLKSFLIPKPPFSEQQEIAHILSTVDKKIEVEEKRKATLKELFRTTLHKLMAGEIRLKDMEI